MTQLPQLILAVVFYMGLASGASPAQIAQANVVHSQIPAAKNQAQPTGDSVFQANCGRCHMPPMVLSPRITGTVVMHMRTRARLSRQDEQLLLKYLAP